MSRLYNNLKVFLIVVFALTSVFNLSLFVPAKAMASDGCDGIATKLSIYSTNLPSPYLKPESSLDPQTINIGQRSLYRYEIQLEDSGGCPVVASSTVHYTVSVSNHAANIFTIGGVDKGESYSYYISSGSSRAGFYIYGKSANGSSPFLATITGVNTDVTAYASATQTVNITAPAPVSSKLSFNDFAHGTSDLISGSEGALPVGIDGIKVKAYSNLSLQNQIGEADVNSTDGSFTGLNTGDDLYRTVFLVAVYPGGESSNVLAFNQSYPSEVGLTQSRDSAGQIILNWTNYDASTTFRVYRSLTNQFDESNFLVATSLPTYTDTISSGTRYSYCVKQVNASGSYTPEYLPIVTTRIDVKDVQVLPSLISKRSTSQPVVTATLSSDLALNPSIITVTWTNTTTNKSYLAGVTVAGNVMTATAPYLDGTTILPDGTYTVNLVAKDNIEINESMIISYNYLVDTSVPEPPVFANLRYNGGIISGLAGAVEKSIYVDVRKSDGTLLTSATVQPDGSFVANQALAVPEDGDFYIIARDLAGNVSDFTFFDVLSVPVLDQNKISIQQNTPSNEDVISGSAGSVSALHLVKIYASDPSVTSGLVPYKTVIAQADGSFLAKVGDNVSDHFWVMVYSGSGLESVAKKLDNKVSVGSIENFIAKINDNNIQLMWTSVADASYFIINVYDVTTSNNIAEITLNSSQTTYVFSGEGNHIYRFYVKAVDAYGNVSAFKETQILLTKTVAKAIIKTSSTTTTKVAPAEEIVTTPTPASSSSKSSNPEKNWTGWIIGLGIIILGLALSAAYLLWGKPVETVVIQPKNKVEPLTKAKSENKLTEKPKDPTPPKPRW